MTTRERYGDAWVCTDCYFAHHYGFRPFEMSDGGDGQRWLVGPDFDDDKDMTDREPLKFLEGFDLADNTCSNHEFSDQDPDEAFGTMVEPCSECGSNDIEDGITDFTWSACDGCHSHLGGSRYRLSLWKEASDERPADHHEQRSA